MSRLSVVPPRAWSIWIARFALAAAVAIGLAYLPYQLSGGRSTRRIAQMRADLARMQAANAAARADNATLAHRIEALKNDPGAIEDIARTELGMVRPHEVVLRLVPAEAGAPHGEAAAAAAAAAGPGSGAPARAAASAREAAR